MTENQCSNERRKRTKLRISVAKSHLRITRVGEEMEVGNPKGWNWISKDENGKEEEGWDENQKVGFLETLKEEQRQMRWLKTWKGKRESRERRARAFNKGTLLSDWALAAPTRSIDRHNTESLWIFGLGLG